MSLRYAAENILISLMVLNSQHVRRAASNAGLEPLLYYEFEIFICLLSRQ